jgi:head-tail adaptor
MRLNGAGLLRRRLVLERPERVEGAGGNATVTWSIQAELWGRLEIRPASGPVQRAEAAHERLTGVVTCRWRTDILAGMRFSDGTAVWSIVAVHDPGGDRRVLECAVELER